MRAVVAFVLVVAALAPGSVHAQSCGGSSGSSGGSSGSSGSSDSGSNDWSGGGGSSESSTPRRPRCVEVSDTLGESRCRRYGRGWNRRGSPSVRFSLGPSVRWLRTADLSFGGTTDHDDVQFQVDSGPDRGLVPDGLGAGAELRLGVTFADWISVGAEVSVTRRMLNGAPRTIDAVEVTPRGITTFEGGAIFGVGLPVDVFTFRPEIYAGIRLYALDAQTRVGECFTMATWVEAGAVVEPRLTVEVFLNNYVGVSATVGTNLLNPGEMHGSLTMSFHTRALDGQPR